MKIVQVSLGKTINIGNYQSVRVEFTADKDEGETTGEVLVQLKTLIKTAEEQIRRETGAK